MFDGNFKSRRTIDLSSGSSRNRRRTNKRKTGAELLEETRQLREERRLEQDRNKGAVALQQITRSYQTRKRVASELSTLQNLSSPKLEWSVSLRLSPQMRQFLTIAPSQVLLEYQQQQPVNNATSDPNVQYSKLRILRAALQEFRFPCSTNLFPLIQTLLHSSFPLDTRTTLDLMHCCQSWMWSNNTSSSQQVQQVATTLWMESSRVFASSSNGEVLAAVTALCTDNKEELNSSLLLEPIAQAFQLSSEEEATRTWFQTNAIPNLLTLLTATSNQDNPEFCFVQHAVQRAVHKRESILLTNLLSLQNGSTGIAGLCTFVQHVLNQRPDLLLLVSLVVKGEDISHLGKMTTFQSVQDEEMKDITSSDEEDEEDVPRSTISSKKRSSTQPLTRQELLTLPKLDKLHHANLVRQQHDLLPAQPSQEMVQLALHLGNPDLWLEWGNAIFEDTSGGTEQQEARKAYILLLHSILMQCSSLKTRPQSTFLSQVAFHRGLKLLAGIHHSILQWNSAPSENELLLTAATTVFCDLFAHHLMVLADEEFLQYYTKSANIDAEQIITHLTNILYPLYWTKPVVASDFDLMRTTTTADSEAVLKHYRARLLLSGTKLWNSLYERWCRLVRHSPFFCEESVWWFPRLNSRDADGVVGFSDDYAMDVDQDEERSSSALASSFRDPKMARILTCIPQALPFERRVRLFSSLLEQDKLKTQNDDEEFRRAVLRMAAMGRDVEDEQEFSGGRERVEIRRDVLYKDSMERLNKLGPKLKRKVQVTFINQHGAKEAGIDGGGVFKEFLDDLIKEAFDPQLHTHKNGAPQLFDVTPLETLAVNSAAKYDLSHYEFLGRVLGKAVYESILVEPQFCLPFLNQLLGKQNTLDDLKNLDAEYYNNLIKLRNLNAAEIDNLGLTFELSSNSGNRELMPGGAHIAVTKQNVIQYVHLVAHYRLNVDGARQTRAFLKGFRDLVPASWVRLFSSNELSKLISGNDAVRGIDVVGMKACMQYAAGYHPSQPIVQWFWQVVEEMTPTQQEKFLKFMTSCSRQPLLGFAALAPAPCIQQLRLPDGLFESQDMEELTKVTPLPTSSTCMNLLKLPNYRNKQLLKIKLLQAIESGAGFELT